MFTTKPLGSIKKFLNQPIALSPRESQQLLKSITSSFRRNLDREHGLEVDEDAGKLESSTPQADPRTTKAATDEHIRSILANPLLTYPKQPRPTPSYQWPRSDSLIHNPAKPRRSRSVPDLQNATPTHHRNPVDVFDQAVAMGIMTRRAATGCMVAVRSQAAIKGSPKLLEKSRMGSRVLDWLRASGQEKTLDFVSADEDGTAFVRTLMQFVLAEGLEGRVWEWIDRLIMGQEEFKTGAAGDKARLLIDRLVVAKHAHSPATISNAIDDVARVQPKLARNPSLEYILYPAWSYLAHLVADQRGASNLKVSATGFDKLLGLGGQIKDLKASILSAHLRLHHPVAPTCEPAMDVFRQSPGIITHHKDSGEEKQIATAAIALAKDTLAFLVNAGQNAEARSLSKVIGLDLESTGV